ncbi:TM2 domain-containing protein [Tenacibaculum sp. TC6]|uniref:TM2 domain-containing protein n=1 Tax=Tenacibaculum sp. TC6 TaxID=3423223 RepID=UPI003D35BF1E
MEIVDENGKSIVPQQESKRILAGVLGILLGGLGVHKFVLNYNKEGIILLSITIASFFLMCLVIGIFTIYIPAIIGFVEGIIYLTKTDEEFIQTYQVNYKGWF